MATEVLELSVKTNIGQSISSLKELKEAIKAAKDEQIAMANKFGATSEQAINASKNLAELKNKVDSLNNASKSLKGSGFEMLKQGFGQIREGLMNLDFDKVKTGLTAMGSGFTSMAKTAKAAFTGIKGAIAATGIGLLVIALGTIYAYWDDIKGVVSGLTTEQKRLNAEAEKNVKIAQDNLDIISQQENILKLQGKTEKEILNMKIAATDQAIEAAIIDLKRAQDTKQAQIDAAKRNREILEGTIDFVTKPLMLLLQGIDLAGKALGSDFGLAKGFKGSIANLIVDPVKVEADLNGSIAAQEKALRKLQNDRAGHELRIEDIGKEGNKKDINGTKETVDKKKQLLEDFAKTQKTAEENELQAIKDKYKDVLAAEIEGSESKKQLLENEQAELKVITDKYEAERRIKTEEELKSLVELQNENTLNLIDDLQERALAELKIQEEKELASIKGMENFEAMKVEIDKKYSKLRGDIGKEADQKEKDRKKALQSFNVGMAQQGLQVIADAAGEGTALAKAAAIAQATISGVQGVQNAFTSANANIGATAGSFGAYPVTMAALAGVFAAANIAKIASGSPASPSDAPPPPSTTTPAPQMMSGAFQLGGGVKPEPMKAFVVTDEMSNSQSQLANIRRRATI
jgi:hypothetical protein